MRILAIMQMDETTGGGALRAIRSVEHYLKSGIEVEVLIPVKDIEELRKTIVINNIKRLLSLGAIIKGFFRQRGLSSYLPLLRRTLANMESVLAKRMEFYMHKKTKEGYDIVLSLHESPDTVLAAYLLSEKYNCKRGSILQLPPFYGIRSRLNSIYRAYNIHYRELDESITYLFYNLKNLIDNLSNNIKRGIFGSFDMLLAVSRSIPIEMNVDWSNLLYLDPGVSLDHKDLDLILKIKRNTLSKDNIVIFSARPVAEKGIVEALYAFRLISKRISSIRLVITGAIDDVIKNSIFRLSKKLGIYDKIIFTGHISRYELFRLKSRALIHLYPSHEDAFPYSVLESLYLGTPVVGYDIPALRLNYVDKGAEGISLVREFDIDGLAEEAIGLIGKHSNPPEIPTWDEIMEREIGLLMKLAGI